MADYGAVKPTRYEGIDFRSKLEATWAAFFDEVRWAWEYEPDGYPGYIPDFILHGTGRRVFVEVKPLAVYRRDRAAIVRKAQRAIGLADDLLILCDDFIESDAGDSLVLGFMPTTPDAEDYIWNGDGDEQAILITGIHGGSRYDFRHTWGGWDYRLEAVYRGDQFFDVTRAEFLKLWSRARNRLQWRPARG